MIKTIWNVFTKTSLTFWLLILIVTTLIIGSFYSQYDYNFFDQLNNNRVINWFIDYGFNQLYKSWWILFLFILMTLLALNTFACTSERIFTLVRKRHEIRKRSFFTLLCPSLIHIAFILTLCGHLITYLTIEHVRYPVQKNSVITLPNKEQVKIIGIKTVNYKESTILKNKLKNAEVTLQIISNRNMPLYKVKILDPVYTGNYFFHIDTAKGKRKSGSDESDKTVNKKSEVKKTNNKTPQFFLLYTYDPGLKIIVFFVSIIFILMLWFYINLKKTQKA